jgi:SPP1 family predicted phage head-tail adaptor
MMSGQLDQRVTLQSLVETQNTFGETVNTYQTIGTVWARVISEKGREAFESARVNARENLRIAIRYREDLNSKSRVQWMGQNYNIVYLDKTLRRDGELWLTLELVGAI